MLNLNSYNEYILDMILEQVDTLIGFQLVERLMFILGEIDHPIAKKLILKSQYRVRDKDNSKITYLDYELFTNKNGKEDVRFIFTQTNKVHSYLNSINFDKENYNYALSNGLDLTKIPRVPGKIGKVITTLFGKEFAPSGKPNEDIESFTNALKSKLIINFDNFEIVEGDEIVKYYNEINYVDYATGSVLGQSCMRYNKCENYIDFYAKNKNKVKLVIMFGEGDDGGEIAGRALLWSLDEIDGEPTDRLFMDRIYTTNDVEVEMFKAFAKKNGWLYKYKQTIYETEDSIDTLTDEREFREFIVNGIIDNDTYPYMDTFKYYNHVDGTLTNKDDNQGDIYKLESTKGNYMDLDENEENHDGMTYIEGEYYNDDEVQWCPLGDEYVLEDDAFYVEWEGEWATKDWMDDNTVYSSREDEYIDKNDALELDYYNDMVSSNYAENNMIWSEKEEEYYDKYDAVYSNRYKSYIRKFTSVLVFLNYNDTDTDYRKEDEHKTERTYFEYCKLNDNGNDEYVYYDNAIINKFVKVVKELDYNDSNDDFKWLPKYDWDKYSEYLNKIDDKNKYFEYEGHYYLNNLKKYIIK